MFTCFVLSDIELLHLHGPNYAYSILLDIVFCVTNSWPVFAGDTVKKTFKVERVRNTSDGNHSVSWE
jgi:hypothetical protein